MDYDKRFDKYLDPNFFQHRVCCLPVRPLFFVFLLGTHSSSSSAPIQIHWFSIFNSFMMVLFLVGLVSMILMRTLRKDYARYSQDDSLDDMV